METYAEKTDMSTHYIAMIETCNTFPKPEMLERLATAFNIESHELFNVESAPDEVFEQLRQSIVSDIKQELTAMASSSSSLVIFIKPMLTPCGCAANDNNSSNKNNHKCDKPHSYSSLVFLVTSCEVHISPTIAQTVATIMPATIKIYCGNSPRNMPPRIKLPKVNLVTSSNNFPAFSFIFVGGFFRECSIHSLYCLPEGFTSGGNKRAEPPPSPLREWAMNNGVWFPHCSLLILCGSQPSGREEI
jgi:hypothetical protein